MNSLKNSNRLSLILLIISVLACFTSIIILRSLNIVSGADYGVDVYYHIKVSDMFPFIAITKVFPWAEMSIWKTHFYDKELGFHFIIYILRNIEALLGISSDAPFNFVSFCFSGFLMLIFSVWAYIKSRKTAFLTIPLLVFISPIFTMKLIILRPALISIILFTATVFMLISKFSFIKKIILIFILSWLYALCYSVPHIILLPLGIYFISQLFHKDYVKNLKYILFPLIAVIGIFISLTLHPQFPNTYLNWYIQGFQVVLKIFGLINNEVGLGAGMVAPSEFLLKQNFLVFVLMSINIVLFLFCKNKNSNKVFLLILQTVTALGFIFSNRFIEYAVPAEVISFSLFIDGFQPEEKSNIFAKLCSNRITHLAAALLLILFMLPLNNNLLKNITIIAPPYKFTEWAEKNLPKNSYIGLLNWGDFPRLFYADTNFRYSMALDPMFSYYVYPERTDVIEKFRLGNNFNLEPQELSNALETNLVYVPILYKNAVFFLVEKGSEPIYFDDVGCLLKLPEPENDRKGI